VLLAIRAVLAPLFDATPSSVRAAEGGAGATVRTGTAVAVGNVSVTSILQSAAGRAADAGTATARQDAAVGNVGIGLANTGLNGALGDGSLESTVAATGPPGTSAASELARLLMPITTLGWLDGPDPYAGLAAGVDVGNLHIDLAAAFRGPEPTDAPGVRVRQASGVVDVGVRIEDPAEPGPTPPSPAPAPSPGAQPVLVTGDANALGNRAVVGVAQSLRSTGPTPPDRATTTAHAAAAGAATAPAGRVSAAAYASVTVAAETPRGTLPATGAGSGTPALAELGLALLALGVVTSACSYAPMRWRGSESPGRVSRR
jgi:hypothetical protein